MNMEKEQQKMSITKQLGRVKGKIMKGLVGDSFSIQKVKFMIIASTVGKI